MRRPEHAIAEIEFAGKVWRGELINLRKDGTRYIEEMSITPVRDTHETIVNFIAIKRDVTERRATESALQSSEKSLANVQHMVPMGSWELESQTGDFRGSPGSLRIFDIIPQSLTTAFQKGESFDIEHRIVRRDGLVRVVRSRGQVVAVASYGECHIAVNGREAVAAFQAALKSGQRYNLVCVDIMMPEMDGQTALKQIRAE
jgi:PAS domain-containing protein